MVPANSPAKTAKDLNGKTFAVNGLKTITQYAPQLWMDKNGGDSSTLKLLEFPISSVADAIAAGRVDSGGLIDPELQAGIDTGKVRWLARDFDAIAPHFMYTGWFTTAEYLAKNKAAVSSFVKAMRESSAFVNNHAAETVDVMAKFTKIEPARIAKMNRIKYATALDPKLIQPMIDAAAKYGFIDKAFPMSEIVYTPK